MKKILVLIVISFLFTSCSTMYKYAAKVILRDKSAVQNRITSKKDDKEIVFVGVHHMGKKEYYEDLKNYLAQARKDGYVIFYEGVHGEGIQTQEELDTLRLKARKIVGYYFDYSGGEATPKHLKVKNGIEGKINTMGIDESVDINADMSLKDIVQKVEEKFGKIKLEPCDFETPLDKKYKCKNYESEMSYGFSQVFRNKYLVEKVHNSEYKKIVIVYGNAHKLLVVGDLRKLGYTDDHKEVRKGKWKKKK